MKYLKSYTKLFKDDYQKITDRLNQVKESLEDILIELKDEGFEVNVYVNEDRSDNYISTDITRIKKFELNDIKDNLLRIRNYLKMEHIDTTWIDDILENQHTRLGIQRISDWNRQTNSEYHYYKLLLRCYPKKELENINKKIQKVKDSESPTLKKGSVK